LIFKIKFEFLKFPSPQYTGVIAKDQRCYVLSNYAVIEPPIILIVHIIILRAKFDICTFYIIIYIWLISYTIISYNYHVAEIEILMSALNK